MQTIMLISILTFPHFLEIKRNVHGYSLDTEVTGTSQEILRIETIIKGKL